MQLRWLGATGRRPAVEVLLAPERERVPFSLPGDNGAFDHAVAREGWVAVAVGESGVALVDGDWFRPVSLGRVWSIAPAANPRLVLVVRDSGDENRTEQPVTVELVDGSAVVIRSTVSSWVNVIGELTDGELVCDVGLLSWGGALRSSPWAGDPVAVISGRYVLAAQAGVAYMYDTRDGGRVRCELPQDAFLVSPVYDSATASVVFRQWNRPWALVAGESIGVQLVDAGFAQHSAAWLDRDRLLLLGEGEHVLLDVRSGGRNTVDGIPHGAYPRVDVTGRFDPEQLKAAQRPSFAGPIPRDIRDRMLVEQARLMSEAASAAGLRPDVIDRSLPAVRVRSCIAPSRMPVGASRFGGRPDLPAGYPWPQHQGMPMAFLAQLRCEELSAALAAGDVPADGLLVVFVAMEPFDGTMVTEQAHLAVIPADGLKRRPWPAGLPTEARFMPSLAAPEPMLSPPNRFELTDAMVDDRVDSFLDAIRPPGPLHQLLGHPATVQHPTMPDGHKQLLRLDSDSLNGTMYGDGGSLQITMPAGLPFEDALAHAQLTTDST